MARATLTLDRTLVPLGGPLEMTYRFSAYPELLTGDEPHTVRVTFLSVDGDIIFTDHHQPPVATTDWNPLKPVTYRRTVFTPLYPYVGPTSVAIELLSTNSRRRHRLDGSLVDGGADVFATFDLAPPPRSAVRFMNGWYRRERDGARQWWWTTQEATLVFRNPGEDSTLYLELEGRPQLIGPQRVDLIIGGRIIDTISLETPETTLHRTALHGRVLGPSPTVEMTLQVEPTFVPAVVQGTNSDDRVLGVRVFHAVLESP